MRQRRPVLGGAAGLLRVLRRGTDVHRGVVRYPVAVGDQQRGGQIGIRSDRGEVAVHHHRALGITRQHHFGVRALRSERRVPLTQCGRSSVDAAHVVEPVPYARVIGHVLGRIVDRLGGDGASLLRELLLESLVGPVDNLPHATVGGDVVRGPLTRACGTHPVDVGAARRRVCGAGRQPDQGTSRHCDRTSRRTRPTKHQTPNSTSRNTLYARVIATAVSRVTDVPINPPSAASAVAGRIARRLTSRIDTVRSRWILAAVSTALFFVGDALRRPAGVLSPVWPR